MSMSQENHQDTEILVEDKAINYHSRALLIVDDILTDAGEFRIYMKLKRYAGKKDSCFPSIKKLAKACGMSETSVWRILKKLQKPQEELNGTPLVKIIKRFDKETNKQKSNLYILTDLELYNVKKYFPGCQNESPPPSNRKPPPFKLKDKEDSLEEDSLEEEDNVQKTMPSPKKEKGKKDFSKTLNADQKKIFNRVSRHVPQAGSRVEENTICAWIKKFGHERVAEVLKVHMQDCEDAFNRGDKIKSMGASMRAILNSNRKLRNVDFEANKMVAKKQAKVFRFLEVTKNYVKIRCKEIREEVYFNLPHLQFIGTLEKYVKMADWY